jgi:hypothetical protein
MAVQKQDRGVGDTGTPLAATLERPDGTAVNLTGLTVSFQMVSQATGADKVAETTSNVVLTDAANGQVKYTFQDADVDTAGTFYAYFRVIITGDDKDTFPAIGKEMEVVIHPRV